MKGNMLYMVGFVFSDLPARLAKICMMCILAVVVILLQKCVPEEESLSFL